MNWDQLGLCATTLLGGAFVLRMVALRLHVARRALWFYVAYQIIGSILVIYVYSNPKLFAYYVLIYASLEAVGWGVTLWMVYALLKAILRNLPGILSLSRLIVWVTFFLALAVGSVSSYVEIASRQVPANQFLVGAVATVERVISTIALLVLLGIISFVMWFRIEMPKNLSLYCIGFLAYFSLKNILFLSRVFWQGRGWYVLGNADVILTCICFLTWTLVISKQGESIPMRSGLLWDRAKQDRLVRELDAINKALLSGAAKR